MNRIIRSALVSLIAVIPALCQSHGYTINTVAGGANPYYYSGAGDGGTATNAALGIPTYDVTVDGAGNLYIVAGSLIRKVTKGGTISTVAGGGTSIGDYVPAIQAELSPLAIVADGAGDLFIADTAFGNSRIRMVGTNGIITTVAGGAPCCNLGDGGPATNAYLSLPYALALDASGSLYIAQVNSQNNLIRKVAGGNITTIAGGGQSLGDGGQATGAYLNFPTGVAVDTAGNLYIAESTGNRVRKVAKTGIITTLATVDSPWHTAVDAGGNVYVTQINDAKVDLITPAGALSPIAGNGTQGFSGDGGPALSAMLGRPAGIVLGGSLGAIYIAEATAGIPRVRSLLPPPSVTVEQPMPNAVISGTATISGWALDNTSGIGTAIGSVQVMVDSNVVGNATYGVSRPDVCTTYPGRPGCPNVGFTFALNTSGLSVGAHTITVTATDTDGNPDAGFASVGVTVTPPNPTVSGQVTVSGVGLSGVTINVTGSQATSATTDANGNYSITLVFGGTYTLSAARGGYSFSSPATFSNLSASQTANFSGIAVAGLEFYSVTPCRIADTRTGAGFSGAYGPPAMAAQSSRTFNIPASSCGIPSTAAAYSLNFTVVPVVTGAPLGNLTTWPTGQPIPNVSTLNDSLGTIVANAAIVPAGTNGAINVFVTDATNVLFDINGYFAPPLASGLEFYSATPCRIADTRTGAGFSGAYGPPAMGAQSSRTFNIPASSCGIPSTATAYSLNFTVVPVVTGAPLGNLTTWPTGQSLPNVSTLNDSLGTIVANAAIVPAGMNGAINIFVTDATNVLFDINGYFAPPLASGLKFYPVTPCRIADTRTGAGFSGAYGPPAMGAQSSRTFNIPASSCGIPSTAAAYSLNFTVVPVVTGAPLGNLTTWPTGQSIPNVSTLNDSLGTIVANAAIVPAGTNGAINVFVTDATNVLFDINGYFAP